MPRTTGWAGATLVMGVVFGLAACGGGGGDGAAVEVPSGVRAGTPSAASDLRADNFEALAPPLVRALLTTGSGGLLDPTGADGGAVPASVQHRPGATAAGVPARSGGRLLAWLARLPQVGRRRALAVSSDTVPCDYAGSIQVTLDDADNNQALSAGDSIAFLADACADDPDLPAASGGFTMTINAVELDGSGEPTALDVTAVFQDFSLAGFGRMNGSFRLWTRQETVASTRLRISFLNTTVTETAGTVRYDYDADSLSNAVSGSMALGGNLQLGGETYGLSSSGIGFAVGLPPSTGTLSLKDAAGDELRLVARSAETFDLAFWPAGATQPAATRSGLRWDDYGG